MLHLTTEETIDIVALDMSGSISDEQGEMLSEVRGIMEQFKDFRASLVF